MTTREKNLLAFLGLALLLILSFVAFNSFYLPALRKAETEQKAAEQTLKTAEAKLASKEKLEPEMRWLERSGISESTPENAQSKLQTLMRKQAGAKNLDIRDARIIPFQTGDYYDRVRVLFKVTGMEKDVYLWLSSIHLVNQRQVITRLVAKPQSNDLTRLEVEVEVEKWIIPLKDDSQEVSP